MASAAPNRAAIAVRDDIFPNSVRSVGFAAVRGEGEGAHAPGLFRPAFSFVIGGSA
jgi:hypothetical protein